MFYFFVWQKAYPQEMQRCKKISPWLVTLPRIAEVFKA